MITLAMAAEIRASRRDVWSAVVDARQVARWRPGFEHTISLEEGWPHPGRSMVWRARIHELPVRVRQRTVLLVPGDRVRSELRIGLFRVEETIQLTRAGTGTMRVGVRLVARSDMPLLGEGLDRFDVRRFATHLASATTQALRDWCERGEAGTPSTSPRAVTGVRPT